MHAVECGELAEGVSQSLVEAHYLQDSMDKGCSELEILPSAQLLQRPISMHYRVLAEVKKHDLQPRAVLLKLCVVKGQFSFIFHFLWTNM